MKAPLVEINREALQQKVTKAIETVYKVAAAGYGPGAGNAILGFRHGAPMLSRDGVTNIKLVRSDDPFEDDIIQAVKQASERNNQKVGDGTTAVTILAYHLYMAARKLEGKGFGPMEIAAKLKAAEAKALEYIESVKLPVGDNLHKIATVSAGDPELGAMIADVMNEVGKEGGVIIEQYEGLGVHNEIIDGFYFAKGYKDTALINDQTMNQSDHKDVAILLSEKPFNTMVDIGPILEELHKHSFRELVIIGEVANEALEVLRLTRSKGLLIAVPVDPPYTVGGRTLFLDDLAVMTGASVYTGADFSIDMLGQAREVLVTAHSTTILEGDGDKQQITDRIQSLKQQLKEETNQASIQFVKDRLARLTNKMAIIRVGGAIEFEREEVKLRVQDAVCAVQSALKDGILPGGGVVLARVKGTDFDDAFKQPFRQLVSNCGLNPETFLSHVEATGAWEGYNLRNSTDKPINLMEEGVVDPSLVIKEVVTNAVAIVSGLITANVAVAYRMEEKQ